MACRVEDLEPLLLVLVVLLLHAPVELMVEGHHLLHQSTDGLLLPLKLVEHPKELELEILASLDLLDELLELRRPHSQRKLFSETSVGINFKQLDPETSQIRDVERSIELWIGSCVEILIHLDLAHPVVHGVVTGLLLPANPLKSSQEVNVALSETVDVTEAW